MESEECMYRFIEEKQIEKVVLEYVLNHNQMEDRCIDVLKVAFDQMISRILLQVKLYIENINQLKNTEKVYDVIQEIKSCYTTYLTQNLDPIEDMESLEIIKMIYDVLEDQRESFFVERENPLEYERTLIESLVLLKSQEALKSLRDEAIKEFKLPISTYNDYKNILKAFVLDAYSGMQHNLKRIVENHAKEINNYEKRSDLIEYLKILQEQKNILESFIHIDLNIDSNSDSNSESNIESDDSQEPLETLTHQFIWPLRHTYTSICEAIEESEQSIKQCDEVEYNFIIKNIENIIEKNIMNNSKLSTLMDGVEANKQNTIDLFLMHVNDELVKVSTKAINDFKRISHPFELICFRLIEHMGTTLAKIQATDYDQVQTEHHQNIIKGVIDTLMLKYDVIKEKNEDFQMERKTNQLDVANRMLGFRKEFEKKCADYLEEAIQGDSKDFERVQARFDKMVLQTMDEAYEGEIRHLNKDILFEIKSFEDIIDQSITRIMEDEQELVQTFGIQICQLFDKMIGDLKKYQIERIYPQAGEKFNGKIHEVILVEESSDFNKGQIIRTKNSGFSIQDRIITRASVVAAK